MPARGERGSMHAGGVQACMQLVVAGSRNELEVRPGHERFLSVKLLRTSWQSRVVPPLLPCQLGAALRLWLATRRA